MTMKTFSFFVEHRRKIKLVSAKELLLLRQLLSKKFHSLPQLANTLTWKAKSNVKQYDTKYNNKVILFITQIFDVLSNLKAIWNLTGTKHSSELGSVIVKSCFLSQFSQFLKATK